MEKKLVNFRLSQEMIEQLEELSTKTGKTKTDLSNKRRDRALQKGKWTVKDSFTDAQRKATVIRGVEKHLWAISLRKRQKNRRAKRTDRRT